MVWYWTPSKIDSCMRAWCCWSTWDPIKVLTTQDDLEKEKVVCESTRLTLPEHPSLLTFLNKFFTLGPFRAFDPSAKTNLLGIDYWAISSCFTLNWLRNVFPIIVRLGDWLIMAIPRSNKLRWTNLASIEKTLHKLIKNPFTIEPLVSKR